MFIGFKGEHNSSAVLVRALMTDYSLLTNSFGGLKKDIEALSPDYNNVVLFGVNKKLKDCLSIERAAEKNGSRNSSVLDLDSLAVCFRSVGIKVGISSSPTHYFCNEAYWYLLDKYKGRAVLIHIPTVKYFDETWIKAIKQSIF